MIDRWALLAWNGARFRLPSADPVAGSVLVVGRSLRDAHGYNLDGLTGVMLSVGTGRG